MNDRPATSSTLRTRTILIAEDDEAVRGFVSSALRQRGFRVLTASDGRTAADLFTADADSIDLVLTDVHMPHALGTDLAAHVRRLRPELPVLFMSAFPDLVGVVPGSLTPAEPLLQKPFTAAALLEAVLQLLDCQRPV